MCAVLLAGGVLVCLCWLGQSRALSHKDVVTRVELYKCADIVSDAGIYGEERDGSAMLFPRGATSALCSWLRTKHPESYARLVVLQIWRQTGDDKLHDLFGNELVYRFPSRRKEAMFDLYGVGRNGVDDEGEGDDILCGPLSDFAPHVPWVFKSDVDREWLLANYGRLRMIDGVIVPQDEGMKTTAPPQ